MLPSIGILSTYPPTQCGIATFAQSLSQGITTAGADVGIVALGQGDGGDAAITHRHRDARDRVRTVAALNRFDVVIVQHEFGIYDGPDGRDVLDLLAEVVVPVITVVHTVPMAPTISQRRIMQSLLNVSDSVVVLSHSAGRLLRRMYRVRPDTLRMIPHGAPDLSKFRLPVTAVRPQVLTWGLIGRGKGIEWGVEALARMTAVTDAEYVVAGTTHPKVRAHEGEVYRDHVRAVAESFGVSDRVGFVDDYLDAARLQGLIGESAAFLLPYDSRDQVTSGVLIEAVAAGGPVIATRFPHAVELLESGAGILVDHGNADEMAVALDEVLSSPERQWEMRARAHVRSQGLRWEEVGSSYANLAASLWRRRGGSLPWTPSDLVVSEVG